MTSGMRFAIFGGTGFIGTHFIRHLLNTGLASEIVVLDLSPPRADTYTGALKAALASGNIRFVQCDVREPIVACSLNERFDVIANLAAVHREPGHKTEEYFATNVLGAENVCAFAQAVGCDRILFTSSISPYGPSEEEKNEHSLPVPQTAYGSSKLVAEKLHIAWQRAGSGRKLLILRPGVVFGPGEGGNVTRLIRSVVRGYFVYTGNRNTRKAGGYVKELCRVITFGLEAQDLLNEDLMMLNFSMFPTPTLEDYVKAISAVAGVRRTPPNVPRWSLMAISHVATSLSALVGRQTQLNPTRMQKLFRSTFIRPSKLIELGYTWSYTLEEAFSDWKLDQPTDFK